MASRSADSTADGAEAEALVGVVPAIEGHGD